MNKIKVGLLGCGAMGGTIIENISDSPYLKSIIGYDINPDALNKTHEKYGIEVTGNLDNILKDSDVKLVYIASSNESHVPLAIQALRAEKAVMTEKPIGLTFEEMEGLLQVQKETGGFIQVGLELRYSRVYVLAKQMIDEGRIGKPVSYHYTYSCSPYSRTAWRLDPSRSGSMIHEKLCHYIDLVRWWNGSRVNRFVMTSVPNVLPYFGIEDNIHVSYSFEDGAVSQLFFTMTAAPTGNSDMLTMHQDLFDQDRDGHKLNYVITGTKGAIEIDVFQRQLRLYQHAGDPTLKDCECRLVQTYTWDKEQDHEHFHNTRGQNWDILRRVAVGEKPALALEDAAETMRLCTEFHEAGLHQPWTVIER